MVDKITDRNVVLWALTIASIVINLVLGVRAITDNELKQQMIQVRQQQAETNIKLDNLDNRVTDLNRKVDCLYVPKVASKGERE